MGWLELAQLLKWPAIIGGAVVLVGGGIWWIVHSIQKSAAERAVMKDDLEEAERDQEAVSRAREAMRDAPKTAPDLAGELRRRLREKSGDDQP